MKAKSLITLALALVFLFSMSIAVSADTAPSGESPGIQVVDFDAPGQGEAPIHEIISEEESVPPAPQGSSNTPYFVGAVIAVLLFIGVAIYCKKHGNKTF